MRKIALLCAFMAVFVCVLSPAQAQDGKFRVPLRVKLGLLQPSNGSLGYIGEVDVTMPLIGVGGYYFTAGYGEFSKSGKRLRMIPLTANYVFALPNPVSNTTGNVYFGLGVGAYLLSAGGRDKTSLGGFGMAGYRLPDEKTFVELKYHLADSVGGVSPRGFALMLGRSF